MDQSETDNSITLVKQTASLYSNCISWTASLCSNRQQHHSSQTDNSITLLKLDRFKTKMFQPYFRTVTRRPPTFTRAAAPRLSNKPAASAAASVAAASAAVANAAAVVSAAVAAAAAAAVGAAGVADAAAAAAAVVAAAAAGCACG